MAKKQSKIGGTRYGGVNKKGMGKKQHVASFEDALHGYKKETTKYFNDSASDAEDSGSKKSKKGKKKGGNVSYGSKAANLGAYVV
jgi:hypothetical protein